MTTTPKAEEAHTAGFIKRAWKRDEGYPVGSPAPGHFDCGCGRQVACPKLAQAENVTCACGQIYDGYGWMIGKVGGK